MGRLEKPLPNEVSTITTEPGHRYKLYAELKSIQLLCYFWLFYDSVVGITISISY